MLIKSRLPLFLLLYICSPLLLGDTLNIAVASNFSATLKKIKPLFEQQSPHRLNIIAASSGKLFAQIRHGAPFDVFMSADVLRPEKLEQLGLTVANSRYTYAFGQLALWSPGHSRSFDYLKGLQFKRLALANPKTAPYGQAARETLQALGLLNKVKARLVRGENINQAYQFVDSGNGDLGFVSLSQVIRRKNDYEIVPDTYYSPIEQQLVIIRHSKRKLLARQFIDFLKQAKIKRLIDQYGYKTP